MNFHCIRTIQFTFSQFSMQLSVLKFTCTFFVRHAINPICMSTSVLRHSILYVKLVFPPAKGVQKSRQATWLLWSINCALQFDLYCIFLCSSQIGFSGVMYTKGQHLHCSDFNQSLDKIIVTQRKICSAVELGTLCEDSRFPLECGR